jgi:hypothetical protein
MNWLAMFIEGEVAKSWDSKPHLDSWVQNPQLPKAFITSRPADRYNLGSVAPFSVGDWEVLTGSEFYHQLPWTLITSSFVFLSLGIQFFMM